MRKIMCICMCEKGEKREEHDEIGLIFAHLISRLLSSPPLLSPLLSLFPFFNFSFFLIFAQKIPAEGEEPEEVPDVADKMDNLFEDLKALEWAGVNISEGEILRLTSSVQKLAAVSDVRFVA
mmetsp:Transcript_43287/g.112499  ORF Transcript_43287/g.112499 Transcript_43287/m.112499 type:complete len:122 (+) Transcript_43287:202-567(+)